MEEIRVLKQGSINAGNWTPRVLSLHSALGLAAVTAKDKSEEKFYQCMRVGNVQIWPQYQAKHIKENFQSAEAKLTIRVKGLPAKIGFRVKDTPEGPVRIYRFTRPGRGAEHLTWMLRFASFDELERGVRIFQSMKVEDAVEASTSCSNSSRARGMLEGDAEEVKQEVDTKAAASIIAGDVEQELRLIRDPAGQKPPPAFGYTTL